MDWAALGSSPLFQRLFETEIVKNRLKSKVQKILSSGVSAEELGEARGEIEMLRFLKELPARQLAVQEEVDTGEPVSPPPLQEKWSADMAKLALELPSGGDS
jgi:hypothetical protein